MAAATNSYRTSRSCPENLISRLPGGERQYSCTDVSGTATTAVLAGTGRARIRDIGGPSCSEIKGEIRQPAVPSGDLGGGSSWSGSANPGILIDCARVFAVL